MVDVDAALKHMFTEGGSDLHIKVPAPPMMRLNGELTAVPGTDKVMPDDSLADRDRAAHDVKHARQRREREHAPVGQEILDQPQLGMHG